MKKVLFIGLICLIRRAAFAQTGRRKWTSVVIGLDTMKSVLRKKLDSIGFTQEIELTAVTDKPGSIYYGSNPLKGETYLIEIPLKTEVIRKKNEWRVAVHIFNF